jgi:hypothetical protein
MGMSENDTKADKKPIANECLSDTPLFHSLE